MSDRLSKDGSRWGARTIREGGRVFWEGRWFRLVDGDLSLDAYRQLSLTDRAQNANKPKYDGRMDGVRGLFYNYGRHHELSRNHVWLHSIVPDQPWPGPSCVDGVFHWETFALEAR